MAQHMEDASLATREQCLKTYDERTMRAINRWKIFPHATVQQEIDRLLLDAHRNAEEKWKSWSEGKSPEPEDQDETRTLRAKGSRRPGAGSVPEVGTEDPEHPAAPEAMGGERLQRQLGRVVDGKIGRSLIDRARAAQDHERLHSRDPERLWRDR